MAGNLAGIHFIAQQPERLLVLMENLFAKVRKPTKQEEKALLLLEGIARKNLAAMDEATSMEKNEKLKQLIETAKGKIIMIEKAVLVIRQGFLSLYWHDRIRVENLKEMMLEYSLKSSTTLGVGVYDNNNVFFCAVNPWSSEVCSGTYWFDEGDVQPANAQKISAVLNCSDLTAPFGHVFSCSNGKVMAETFEKETGIQIYLDESFCKQLGFVKYSEWPLAVIYDAR